MYRTLPSLASFVSLAFLLAGGGCQVTRPQMHLPPQGAMPRELCKTVLPTYTIEPPDILLVDAVQLVPGPAHQLRAHDVVSITVRRGEQDPLQEGDLLDVRAEGVPIRTAAYKLLPGDVLRIEAFGLPETTPVDREFQVQDDGQIRLRVSEYEPVTDETGAVVSMQPVRVQDYGLVPVSGKTVEEAEKEIQAVLTKRFPQVAVVATLSKELIAIDGSFEVDRAGDVVLPLPYGRVSVKDKSVVDAEQAIGERVGQFLYQWTVQVALATDTPISGSFLVEVDGRIDLNNPVRLRQMAGMADAGPAALPPPTAPAAGELVAAPAGPKVAPQADAHPRVAQQPREGAGKLFYEHVPDVTGLTVDGAAELIKSFLQSKYFKDIDVWVTLEQPAAQQDIAGEHLVGPDGTVTLGTYGSVSVVGMTLAQAKQTIEQYLSQFFVAPEVSVDVFSYNSKKYYVVTQGAGMGDGVYAFPITGNDTVLDAISQINGLQAVSSKRIWVARPSPRSSVAQVMPVDWEAITAQGSTATNYQLLPGDRLFISEDKLIAFDTNLGKFIAPIERIMGLTMLGAETATRLSGPVLGGGGDRRYRGW